MSICLFLQAGCLVIDEEGCNSENDTIHTVKERHFRQKLQIKRGKNPIFGTLKFQKSPLSSLSHILAFSRPFREIMFARSLCSLSRNAARSTSVMSHIPAMAFSTDMKVDPATERKVCVKINA